MRITCLFLLAGVLACFLTGMLRYYAVAKNIIDIPNERSSHTIATPRGGGVAIVFGFLLFLLPLRYADFLSEFYLIAFLGSGIAVALTGFLDDHKHIPARWRLLAHFGGAAWGLYWLGGIPPVNILGWTIEPGWIGQMICLVYLVWLLNLYNFMDGIDGIAGIEAITVCLGGVTIYLITDPTLLWQEPALLAAAVAGFLWWNFPPAKIFMGDAGSGFLGITLGLFSIQAASSSPQLFWSWLILLGVFIVDATVTLARRFIRHEKIYEAHCSHAYQHAARYYQAHKPVSLAVGAINLGWLLPVAIGVGIGGLDGFWGLVIAYFPLLVLALHFKAGVEVIKS